MRILLACLVVFSLPAAAQEALSLHPAPEPVQSSLVPVLGIVSGAPESVTFSGNAVVKSRLAPDPDFNRPRVVLTLDLTGVTGVGSTSGAKYAVSGTEVTHRGIAASHTVEFPFPFKSSVSGSAATPRTGVASFVLDFDVNTGAVIRASANVASPNFPQ